LIAGIFSCSEDDIIETIDNTRISKIKLEESRSFNSYWVIVDLDYVDDKLSSIYLNENSQQSNSGLLNQYEYDNEKIIDKGVYKETYTFNSTNLIEWMCENDNNGQIYPLEKIQYEYEDNNLISFIHYIGETLDPYKYDTLSYDGNKLINYKSFYAPDDYYQSELDKECTYNYQDNILLSIDRVAYESGNIYNSSYSFNYEGSKIVNIELYNINGSERNLNKSFEFSFDELGRIKIILYKNPHAAGSYIEASEAKWTFTYEQGKSNLQFEEENIPWKIININSFEFPEKLINDFFTIYPE
jgi:hypothetical protein